MTAQLICMMSTYEYKQIQPEFLSMPGICYLCKKIRQYHCRACASVASSTSVHSVVLLLVCLVVSRAVPANTSGAVEAIEESSVAETSQAGVTQKPRWEIGIGGGYFSGFDYPASNEKNDRGIALPFFVYRTPIVRFGDGGIRAVAIENPRIKLDLSIGGSLNASSDDNSARQGLPDLDFLFEIGPQLEVRLLDKKLDSGARLRMRFTSELRAVFSTDFRGVDSRGFVADFGVGASLGNVANTGVTLVAALDAGFATERLQDYFYQVDEEFVTDTRPFFDAQAGYLESRLFGGVAFKPFSRVRVFTGIIHSFFNGARNRDSPLFETTQQTSFALGVVWTIKSSDEMVDVVDLGGDI